MSLNVSIVLYHHSVPQVAGLVKVLRASGVVSQIFLIDNSASANPDFAALDAVYFKNSRNTGYGSAHNIAIKQSIATHTDYHLVVNPDIMFEPLILVEMLEYLNKNTEIGHLMPKVCYSTGEIQYLCKLLPTPFDLIFRRFFPDKWTQKRRDYFELRASGYNKIMDVPYMSGCFMLLRIKAIEEVGLFDERFFMYPEDIDLTRRINSKYRTVFYPNVSIVHHHAKSSYHNGRMLLIHIVNMIRYFNKWGWFFDAERRRVNKAIIKSIAENREIL